MHIKNGVRLCDIEFQYIFFKSEHQNEHLSNKYFGSIDFE